MSHGGELCGACGSAMRPAALFCGRCGAEQGFMVPRDGGLGRPMREPSRARRPAIGLGGVGLALGLYFALLLPQLVVLARGGAELGALGLVELCILGLGIVGLAALRRDGLAVLGRPRGSAALLARYIGAALALAAAVLVASHLVPQLFLDERAMFPSLGVGLLMGALLPAVAEELAFRGAILTSLQGAFEDRTAAVIAALLFAALHLSPMSAPHLALLGYLLARVRISTGSVWPCVLIHALYNAVLLVVSFAA